MKNIFYSLIVVSILSCGKEKSTKNITHNTLNRTENVAVAEPKKLSTEEILKNINGEVLNSLQTKDYDRFASYIHPEKGVRFSMYAYVNPKKDKLFSREDFIKYISTETQFTWGERDGSGELLILSLNDYLQTWVYKRDFEQSQYFLNQIKGHGNSLNNVKEIYPTADFTENYVSGSEPYSGMNWKSLRFVFEISEGDYKLVAVINDEWTI